MSDLPDLDALGLTETAVDTLAGDHALRLARTLDLRDDVLADGVLPLTWIWVFFSPSVPSAGLRDDGHPAGDADGALAGLDRRMFIGGSLERSGDLRVDTETHRSSRIVSADVKDGSSGQFVIVDVEHRYDQSDNVVLVERQNLMYRRQPDGAVPAPGPAVDPPPSSVPLRTVVPDERLLFRFSALTFNTHRIHYDLPYATGVEHYPGLVVHGPLTATLLAHLAGTALGAPLTRFEFRATTPTFAGTPVHLVVDAADGDDTVVRAVRDDGAVVMKATAR